MLSREALRQAAQSLPAVTVDSATLLALLNDAERAPKPRKPRAAAELDPNVAEDEKCARWLFDTLRKTLPNAKEPNFATWAKDVRLMRERDGRTRREICELFQWAHADAFWCSNILSPAKLREQWDRLSIQRAKAAEPKKQGGSAWWISDHSRLAKAIEVGVGPALNGESTASWETRIRAAIDNGGKPPAPQVFVRPTPPAADLAPAQDQVRKAPGFLKEMLRKAQEGSAA